MSPHLLGVATLAVWSVTTLAVAYTAPMPPFQLAALTLFMGFCTLTAWQAARGEDIKASWTQKPAVYMLGLYGIGGYTSLLYLSFRIAPVFEVNTLNYLWPILLAFFYSLIFREKLGPRRIAGLVLGFAGASLLFSSAFGGQFDSRFIPGYLCALSAAIIWASYSTLTRKIPFPPGAMGPIFLYSAVPCLILHLTTEETVWPGGMVPLLLVFLGLSRVTYVLWDHAMKHADIPILSSLAYFVPLVSAFLFAAFGRLPLTVEAGISAALIILGCLMVNASNITASIKKALAKS